MISKLKRLLLSLVLLVFVAFTGVPHVGAQSVDKEKAEQEAAKREDLAKNALKLLDEAIGGAASLKLRENRFYVLASAADVLWAHDEKRARSLFWEALGNHNLPTYPVNLPVANNSAKPSGANTFTKEQSEALNKYHAGNQARREFLQKVARHDPQLALDMMRSTRQEPPEQIPGTTRFDPEAELEQDLMWAAEANDSKRALQIARESLAKGLTFQIVNVLRQVNQKDQQVGTQLADDIVTKLKTENLNSNNFAPHVAVSLLEYSRATGAVLIAVNSTDVAPFTRLKLDDHQKQDLVEMLTNAALNPTSGRNLLQTIPYVLPEIQQYLPDRLAKVKSRLADYNRTLPVNERAWNNFETEFGLATPEEMIRAAGKLAEPQRGALFFHAASKAVTRGEADKYRELINSQIESEADRKAASDILDSQQMYYDIDHGKTDDLEKLLPLLRVKEQRVIAMTQLAILFEKQNRHEEAVKLLDEARELVKVNLTDAAQSDALLAVMLGYTLVDPPKAFAMIEPVIDKTNDDISKLLLLDRIVKTGGFRNGEIILNQSQMPLDHSLMKYSAGLVALAKVDFDRTKALAERFQRDELKVVGRLLLAQAVLRDAEKRVH
jgi:hypothetical protein